MQPEEFKNNLLQAPKPKKERGVPGLPIERQVHDDTAPVGKVDYSTTRVFAVLIILTIAMVLIARVLV